MILGFPDRPDPFGQCFAEIDAAVGALTTRLVVFNAHSFPVPSEEAVVYNLDVLGLVVTDDRGGRIEMTAEDPKFARNEIWDFSARNVEKWRAARNFSSRTRPVHHVPVGYHPSMRRFRPLSPEVDVVFTGRMNERRRRIVSEIASRGLRVSTLESPHFGTRRDSGLARCKVAINMLYYTAEQGALFPVLRAAHLAANDVPMVSEIAPETPAWATSNQVPYDDLARLACDVARSSDAARRAYARASRLEFERHPLRLPR